MKDCKMASMHHMSGAILELPDQTLAFVHVSGCEALTLTIVAFHDFSAQCVCLNNCVYSTEKSFKGK